MPSGSGSRKKTRCRIKLNKKFRRTERCACLFTVSAFSFADPAVLRSVALKSRCERYEVRDGVVRGNMPKALKAFGTAVSRFRLRFNRLVIHTAFFIFSEKPRLPILHMDYPLHPTGVQGIMVRVTGLEPA